MTAIPTCIPDEWDDNTIVLFGKCCSTSDISASTVRDRKTRGVGPRWWLSSATARSYTTTAEVRRPERGRI